MSDYFNERRRYEGTFQGGRAKVCNITFRDFTDKFKWENEHLARWINRCLILQEMYRGKQPDWTEKNLRKLWEQIDGKDLLNDDRVEHAIIVDSEETEEEGSQATSASLHCEPSVQLCRQISGLMSGDRTSLGQLMSVKTGSSCHSLGKRSRMNKKMAEGSEESLMVSRDRKRVRPLP